MDGLRNDDGVEWMDVELMSTRGPRANGRGMDEHPGRRYQPIDPPRHVLYPDRSMPPLFRLEIAIDVEPARL